MSADHRDEGVGQANKPDSVSLLSPLSFDVGSWVHQPDPGVDLGFGLGLGWPSQGGYGEDVDHDDDEVDDDDNGVDDDDHVTGSPAAVLSQGPPSPLFPDTRIAEPAHPRNKQGQGHPHRQAFSEHPDDQGHPLLGNHDCIPPTGLISALSSPSPALTTSQFDFTTNPYSNLNNCLLASAFCSSQRHPLKRNRN